MNRYRKKPVIIEAMHFNNNNESDDKTMNEICLWVNKNDGKARHDGTNIFIETLEGEMRSEFGDYIIKGVEGEFYPCKPNIFKKTYNLIVGE